MAKLEFFNTYFMIDSSLYPLNSCKAAIYGDKFEIRSVYNSLIIVERKQFSDYMDSSDNAYSDIESLATDFIQAFSNTQNNGNMSGLVGEVKMWAGINLPSNEYLRCEGQILNINLYPELYNAISNTYGGDGITTFALPDLRDKVALGAGTTFPLGQSGGSNSVTLTESNLPSHTHDASNISITGNVTVGVNNESPDTQDANGAVLGQTNADDVVYTSSGATGSLGGVSHNLTAGGTIGNTGGGSSFSVVQAYTTVAYIIKVQ